MSAAALKSPCARTGVAARAAAVKSGAATASAVAIDRGGRSLRVMSMPSADGVKAMARSRNPVEIRATGDKFNCARPACRHLAVPQLERFASPPL
jgi:hypothetical protein